MWILSFLPDWLFYAIFFIGVLGMIASFVMEFIPFVKTYRLLIQIVSSILIVIGSFMSGAISDNNEWEMKVSKAQTKVDKAEVKSAEENVQIITKIVNRTRVVKEHGEDVIKYIDKEVIKYDDKCVIPNEFVKALNDAAEPPK